MDEREYKDMRRDIARRWRHRQKANAVAALGGKCERCGWNEHIFGLEFDHKDPSKKIRTPSSYMCGVGKDKFLSYVKENCRLLCANCHALKTVSFADNIANDKVAGDMSEERRLFDNPTKWPFDMSINAGNSSIRAPGRKEAKRYFTKEHRRKMSEAATQRALKDGRLMP